MHHTNWRVYPILFSEIAFIRHFILPLPFPDPDHKCRSAASIHHMNQQMLHTITALNKISGSVKQSRRKKHHIDKTLKLIIAYFGVNVSAEAPMMSLPILYFVMSCRIPFSISVISIQSLSACFCTRARKSLFFSCSSYRAL